MIAKAFRGNDVARLLRYLFGPGRNNEHTDARLVAAWDTDWLPGGPLAGLATARLARALDAPRRAHRLPADQRVYHVAISLPSADGPLEDGLWREIVDDAVAALRLKGCRWVAVHHGRSANGNDHVHLVVTLTGPGGHLNAPYRDWRRWRVWCHAMEVRYGLTPTTPPGAGRSGASRAEAAREARAGQVAGTQRRDLVLAVHAASVAASGESEFFAGLAQRRLAVRVRTDPGGRVCGYAVTRTGRHGRRCGPWISGSRLRRDLSLPRLRARWAHTSESRGQNLGVLLRGCEGEMRQWFQDHPEPEPVAWCAAAREVADLAITVARWRPELTPAALELAGVAQPVRARDRSAVDELVLPLLRLTVHTLAAGEPGTVLLAAAVVTLAALAVLLEEAVRFYRAHAAARRGVRHTRQSLAVIVAGHGRPAGPAPDRQASRAAVVRTSAGARTTPSRQQHGPGPASPVR